MPLCYRIRIKIETKWYIRLMYLFLLAFFSLLWYCGIKRCVTSLDYLVIFFKCLVLLYMFRYYIFAPLPKLLAIVERCKVMIKLMERDD